MRKKAKRKPLPANAPAKNPFTVPVLMALVIAAALVFFYVQSGRKQMEPPPRASSPAQKAATQSEPIDLKLKNLILSHPRKEISQELFNLIDKGEVLLNFQTELTQAMGAIAQLAAIRMNDGKLKMVLVVIPEFFDPAHSVEYRNLVIYHEYIHIRQVKEGRLPIENLEFKKVSDGLTEADVKSMFESETEAYAKEAELAKEINANELSIPEPCLAYLKGGTRGLRQTLADTYSHNPLFKPHLNLLEQLAQQEPQFKLKDRASMRGLFLRKLEQVQEEHYHWQ